MAPSIGPSMDSLSISREQGLMEEQRNSNEEELLLALKPIVTSRDLLTQNTASFQAPHKFEYRLEVSATRDNNHYLAPRYLKPDLCKWPEPIGTLTTKELFLFRFIIDKSRGTAKEIEIRFLHSRCIWSAKMLMEWFTIFRDSVVGMVYYTQDQFEVSNHEKQEKRFVRRIAKSGMALHSQHGPVKKIDQEWQDEDWVRIVHELIVRLKSTHHHEWCRVKDLYSIPRREDDRPTRTLVYNMQAYARLYFFSPLDERPATGDHTYQTPDQSEDEGER
ncbi:hypothetical protein KVT40_003570 [Elsinoe batatas]|uniref:Uncharacterized protein n=1 Tax=Elsinoe batatas TaxID=2601811 RepID=A0A8K0L242_9PEZI|nr:hypothetical protein KVT40_003570 [Elsinoe batatas]